MSQTTLSIGGTWSNNTEDWKASETFSNMSDTHGENWKGNLPSNDVYLFSGGFGVIVVATLGVIMNILSLLVFLQPQMRSLSINILLIGLQVADLLVVSSLLYTSGLTTVLGKLGLGYEVWEEDSFFNIIFNYVWALGYTGKVGSHYFTILVSVERYIGVCYPLMANVLCSRSRAVIALTSVTTFSILFTLPHWLYKVNNLWYQIHWFYVEVVIIIFIPFVLILVLNIAIYIGYRKSHLETKCMETTSQKEDNSITLLLLSIVLVFLFCNTFVVIRYLDLILHIPPSYWIHWFVNVFIHPQRDLFVAVNSATNFIFYCAFGTKFRNELKKVLGCHSSSEAEHRRIMHEGSIRSKQSSLKSSTSMTSVISMSILCQS